MPTINNPFELNFTDYAICILAIVVAVLLFVALFIYE